MSVYCDMLVSTMSLFLYIDILVSYIMNLRLNFLSICKHIIKKKMSIANKHNKRFLVYILPRPTSLGHVPEQTIVHFCL